MSMLKMLFGAATGAVGGMPKWLLYVIAALAMAFAVWGGWSAYSAGQRLHECRASTDNLQDRLAVAVQKNADLQADKAKLQSAISDQNQQITQMESDAARANQAADRAAGAYRAPPTRDIPANLEPESVNEAVRRRIEDLVP